jgi:hypothetical protein
MKNHKKYGWEGANDEGESSGKGFENHDHGMEW